MAKCWTVGEVRPGLPERERYAIVGCNFGWEMILWTTILVSSSDISYIRQVVCYLETSSCEVLNK